MVEAELIRRVQMYAANNNITIDESIDRFDMIARKLLYIKNGGRFCHKDEGFPILMYPCTLLSIYDEYDGYISYFYMMYNESYFYMMNNESIRKDAYLHNNNLLEFPDFEESIYNLR